VNQLVLSLVREDFLYFRVTFVRHRISRHSLVQGGNSTVRRTFSRPSVHNTWSCDKELHHRDSLRRRAVTWNSRGGAAMVQQQPEEERGDVRVGGAVTCVPIAEEGLCLSIGFPSLANMAGERGLDPTGSFSSQ